MLIKKNAGKANIPHPTKENVKTPFSECTAENPLKCKFHGVKAATNILNAAIAQSFGNKKSIPFAVKKQGKAFAVDGDFSSLSKSEIDTLKSNLEAKRLSFAGSEYHGENLSKLFLSPTKGNATQNAVSQSGGDVVESPDSAPNQGAEEINKESPTQSDNKLSPSDDVDNLDDELDSVLEGKAILNLDNLDAELDSILEGEDVVDLDNLDDELDAILEGEDVVDIESPNITSTEDSPQKTEGILLPLIHDEGKFPPDLTKEVLDNAIAHGKKAGGHGGLNTTIVEIGGKKYICKNGSGKQSDIIKNGYTADMAYRAGGIYSPDAKLYEFGDGKTYKLSEFIEGQKLIDVWKSADESKRNEIRNELLKGYPLDCLFSNFDVLGTSPEESQSVTILDENGKKQHTSVAFDNIILGNDGHAYRIDNDGSFAMTGKGGTKKSTGGQYTCPIESEQWDKWADRQWIDEFRTMRRNVKNAGVFDRYTTADIFRSAAHINFNALQKALATPETDNVRKALQKPMFEMRQMAYYAKGAELAGYKTSKGMEYTDNKGNVRKLDIDPASDVLDAIYNAHKAGVRRFLQHKVSWLDGGWLQGKNQGQVYKPQPFPKAEPQSPEVPLIGTDMAKDILEGVKTIAYHAKQGDFMPNESRIKKALATKPFLESLSAHGDAKAKKLLEAVAKIEDSIRTGHKKELSFDTPDGLFDVKGLSLVVDEDNIKLFKHRIKDKITAYETSHKKWVEEKSNWDNEEKRKQIAAGAAPTKSFQEYEDLLVKANIDTNGIQQGGGDPSINHDSKQSQKSSSFKKDACLKKVRQYAMMGLSFDDMQFADDDKVFYNGFCPKDSYHISGGDGKPNYLAAVEKYKAHPNEFKTAMKAYAVHKACLILAHANMENEAIDHDLGTVFVIRREHVEAFRGNEPTSKDSEHIIPRYPIDSSTSAGFNSNGCLGTEPVGWKIPFWRITDAFIISNYGSDHEKEICVNPINNPYPPMYFDSFKYPESGSNWKSALAAYLKDPTVQDVDEMLKKKFTQPLDNQMVEVL